MQIIDNIETYDVLNVSGGIQSTTLFYAAIFGEIPRPDCAIFADTGWERKSTYQTLDRLKEIAEDENLPFHVVSNGNIRVQAIESGNSESDYGDYRDAGGYGFLKMPVFTIDQRGNKKMANKQCTTEFKIRPIRKFLREHYGMDSHFKQWIGISLDEAQRMRKSNVQYISFWYPLVEMRWTRGYCIEWLKRHDIEIPTKSACIGCPLHSNHNWHALTDDEKAEAIEFDEQIRNLQAHIDALPKPKKPTKGQLDLIDIAEVDRQASEKPLERKQDVQLFAHSSGLPLKDVLSGSVEVQEELYNHEDNDCGGNCFI